MQQKQGDRAILSLSNPRNNQTKPKFDYGKKRAPGAQRILAHDKKIKQLKESGESVKIELVSGRDIYGVITESDKYSITIKEGNQERCFFKHAIECFGEGVEE